MENTVIIVDKILDKIVDKITLTLYYLMPEISVKQWFTEYEKIFRISDSVIKEIILAFISGDWVIFS